MGSSFTDFRVIYLSKLASSYDGFHPHLVLLGSKVTMKDGREEEARGKRTSGREASQNNLKCFSAVNIFVHVCFLTLPHPPQSPTEGSWCWGLYTSNSPRRSGGSIRRYNLVWYDSCGIIAVSSRQCPLDPSQYIFQMKTWMTSWMTWLGRDYASLLAGIGEQRNISVAIGCSMQHHSVPRLTSPSNTGHQAQPTRGGTNLCPRC